MGLLDHRRVWRLEVRADPQACIEAFRQGLSKKALLLLSSPQWDVAVGSTEAGLPAAVATYVGRGGLVGVMTEAIRGSTGMMSIGVAERDKAVGSQIAFDVVEHNAGLTVCEMRLAKWSSHLLFFIADARFIRASMNNVANAVRGLDASAAVAVAQRAKAGGSSLWLVISILAAVLAGIFFVLDGLSGPASHPVANAVTGPTTQTHPPAGQVAATIDEMLSDSVHGRALLNRAITDINACRLGENMWANLNGAIDNRSSLIARADALDVANLPEGSVVKQKLRAIFVASHAADIAYRDWVNAAGGGCPRTSDVAYVAIPAANSAAQAAKRDFLETWNPLAARYGLPARSNADV